MNAKYFSILVSGIAGFICGGLLPILLVVLMKFSVGSICSPGKFLARLFNLKSSFSIYSPTEVGIELYGVLFTMLIYAFLFAMIFVGFKILFGSSVQRQ